MPAKITKRELIWELSTAIDFVGVTDQSHGKRVAYIAYILGSQIEDFPWTIDDIIYSGLLHDCGVSSTDLHEHLVNEMEYEFAQEHCYRGYDLLSDQDDFMHFAKAIKEHHTRWDSMIGLDYELLGNLIFLADRIDVLSATSEEDILLERNNIMEIIKSHKGTLFNPEYIDIFLTVGKTDIFWLNWEDIQSGIFFKKWIYEYPPVTMTYRDLIKPLSLFSNCVDGKSPYTYNHSVGVASLSKKIAKLIGYSGDNLYKIEIAALMHDLGKLKVPDYILEKTTKLTEEEKRIIKHHSYDTYSILSRIDGMDDVSIWASQHHERLNGGGYPKSDEEELISKESRILAIADIFQALAQSRPYRNAKSLQDIIYILNDMSYRGELDNSIVDVVIAHSNDCLLACNL